MTRVPGRGPRTVTMLLLSGALAGAASGPPVTAPAGSAVVRAGTHTTAVDRDAPGPDEVTLLRVTTRAGVVLVRVVADVTGGPGGPGGAVVRAGQDEARWAWPVGGRSRVVRGFDPPAQRWSAGHRGVDLSGTTGEPVRSVAQGVVSFSGEIAGTGVVSVRHPDGLLSTYQPVSDRPPRGRAVARGDLLGTLAAGGHCPLRTCLHLGARRGQTYLDPLLFLTRWQVSLLAGDR